MLFLRSLPVFALLTVLTSSLLVCNNSTLLVRQKISSSCSDPEKCRETSRSKAEHQTTPHASSTSTESDVQWLDDYEYVVVGSGPGGSPLAARLAIAGYKVLLIDAGDDQGDSLVQQIPALQLQSTEFEGTKWEYFVNHYTNLTRQEEDTKMSYGLPDGSLYVGLDPPEGAKALGILYPRAGTLGGCAAHNAMITIYPHQSDWTNLANITGDDSWLPGPMRTFFKRLEQCRYTPNDIIGHGFDGWLQTSLTDLTLVAEDFKLLSLIIAAGTAIGKTILAAVVETVIGLASVLTQDLNNDLPSRDNATGLYQVPITVNETGFRTGPRDFILATVGAVNSDGSRKYHLDLQLNTLVTAIRFEHNGTTPRASGVNFMVGQSLYRADPRSINVTAPTSYGSVNATREVIVSAGTFNTPQLLKLSGIGPADELKALDIPVLVDLPGVGTNMQDRYEVAVVGESNTDFAITRDCTFLTTEDDPCKEQWLNGITSVDKGVYSTNGIAIASIMRSSVAEADPDLLISGAPAFFKGYYPGYSAMAEADAKHWSWIMLKAHTRNNAGTVKLVTADPRDTPSIDFNYFDSGTTADSAAAKDLQAIYEALNYSRQIYKDLIPLQGNFTEVWPGPNVSSEAEVKKWIQDEAWGHHACCTAAVGADDDKMAVLDSGFRVRGVESLRVVDASAFAKIPGYYIVLPTYMISEKAAEVIIADAVALG